MKLALLVVGLLLVSNTATAVPRDMADLMQYLEDKISNMQDVAEDEVDGNMQDGPEDEVELTGGQETTPEDTSTIDEDGEGKGPDVVPAYLEEVEEQQYSDTDADMQQNNMAMQDTVIYNGNRIALQSYIDHNWLGCAGHVCSRATCPRMFMMGPDWSNCWGEVFQIYRLSHKGCGAGPVLVGDQVGIYYPRQPGRWLGCAGHFCGKAGCPGHPNNNFGFSNPGNIGRCWGEVFKIYAYGKGNGQTISSDDQVALFYPRENKWLALGHSGHAHRQPCLGTGLPPPRNKWDGCAWENFRIIKMID